VFILPRLCFSGLSEKLPYVQDEYIAVIVELPVEAVGDGCCDGLVENPRGSVPGGHGETNLQSCREGYQASQK
jgi:hypothetical protein